MVKENLIIREVLRYISVPYETADQALKEEVLQAYQSLKAVANLRVVYELFELEEEEEGIALKSAALNIKSYDLKKLLQNCNKVYLLAATLGTEVDKKISSVQRTDMMKALIYNGCANVMIEEACDQIEGQIMKELGPNEFLTMRYSPGYGDVDLKVQNNLLSVLNGPRRIGMTTTKNGMLIPLKSITAFIGVSRVKEERQKTCQQCLMHETCTYKRRGERCGN